MVVDHFLSWVEPIPEAGCWIWMGHVDVFGYGKYNVPKLNRVERAHRMSFKLFKGPIPRGQSVLHRCDVRCCTNPAHLFLGSARDNVFDMIRKGRSKAIFPRLTPEQVIEIRGRAANGEPHRAIAVDFAICVSNVSQIATRRRWGNIAEGAEERQ